MDILKFESCKDLVQDAVSRYKDYIYDDGEDISIIAKYIEAKEIIEELINSGYGLHSIEIDSDEDTGYDSEYIITLFDNEVWCEPMLREGRYLDDGSYLLYIINNCSSKVIPHCEGDIIYEVSIDEIDDECECDECEKCNSKNDIKIKNDGDMHGFSVNQFNGNSHSSFSFYADDMDLVNKIAKVFM